LRGVRALQLATSMRRQWLGFLMCLSFTGCLAGDPATEDPIDGDSDGSAEEPIDDPEPIAAGNAAALIIGFNAGFADQFDYFDDFYKSATMAPPRLCHAYVSWNVANQAPHAGNVADHASRAFIEDWFTKARGHCDEALITFKAMTHGAVPSTDAFAAAFEKFAAIDWLAETGFTGSLAFTAWNEPNNAADSGNGLGVQIPARVAARYYLAAERSCRKHACKVAAGDFASNGNMWDDYRMNCRDDNVTPATLCKEKSPLAGNRGPSYLDVYKNEIVNRASEFGLPAKTFRPDYFAFHGWHDSNSYLNNSDHCSTYESCTLRRILYTLRGSWGGSELWNTEDGIGQSTAPDDSLQACGAAFVIRLQSITSRVKRLYVTRLHGGPGQLLVDHNPRPSFGVLGKRLRDIAGGGCK
jgi:hypothetical protein